jgi:hypothetical protein
MMKNGGLLMERVFFSLSEANTKVGRKVWVKVNNLYINKGVPGTVVGSVCLDDRVKGFGMRIQWNSSRSGSDAVTTVFTKNEYENYLNEEHASDPRITFD